MRFRFRSVEIYCSEENSRTALVALTQSERFFVGDCDECEEHTVVARCPHGAVRCGGCTHHSLCSDESGVDWPEMKEVVQ